MKTDGSLWAWGQNDQGQLGNGTFNKNRNPNPTQITISDVQSIFAGHSSSFAIKKDGSLWGWGENKATILNKDNYVFRYTTPKQIMDSGVASMALGSQHILVLKTDGSVWGWGYTELLADPSVGIEFLKFPRKTSLDKAAIPTISISDKKL